MGGAVAPNGPSTTASWGRGVPPRRRSMLKEDLRGVAAPNGPGSPAGGDEESCSCGGRCSRRARMGHRFPMARAHQTRGTGRPAQAVVGAQRGPAGGSSSQRPGHISPRGRGTLSRRWSVPTGGLRGAVAPNAPGSPAWGDEEPCTRRWLVLKEGVRGASTPNGRGRPAWRDGESCLGGGQCSKRAWARGGGGGVAALQRPGLTSLRG